MLGLSGFLIPSRPESGRVDASSEPLAQIFEEMVKKAYQFRVL
jgi:hypothetical protein